MHGINVRLVPANGKKCAKVMWDYFVWGLGLISVLENCDCIKSMRPHWREPDDSFLSTVLLMWIVIEILRNFLAVVVCKRTRH